LNTDIRIKIGLATHYKTKNLVNRLGEPAFRCLIALWEYAAQYRPSGELKAMSAADIAEVSNWTGNPEAFVAGLLETGWLDKGRGSGRNLKLHDWKTHQPYVFHSEKRSRLARKAAQTKWEKIRGKQKTAGAPSPAPDPDPSPIPSPAPDPPPQQANSNEPTPSPPASAQKPIYKHPTNTKPETHRSRGGEFTQLIESKKQLSVPIAASIAWERVNFLTAENGNLEQLDKFTLSCLRHIGGPSVLQLLDEPDGPSLGDVKHDFIEHYIELTMKT
jgi:hypothetical protein